MHSEPMPKTNASSNNFGPLGGLPFLLTSPLPSGSNLPNPNKAQQEASGWIELQQSWIKSVPATNCRVARLTVGRLPEDEVRQP